MRIAFVLTLLIAAIGFGVFLLRPADTTTYIQPTHTLTIAGVSVPVALARTSAERTQGLSGITNLRGTEGMFFVFEEDGRHGFWMKDMLFPIDILWLSFEGRVVHIERMVQPSSYPEALVSPVSARYVLEVPSGFSDVHGIKIGDSATLSGNTPL